MTKKEEKKKDRDDILRASMIKVSSAFEGDANLGDELP